MIKRLRQQFVVATMVLMAVMLSIILGIICYTTYSRMENETSEALALASKSVNRQEKPEKGTAPSASNSAASTEPADQSRELPDDPEAMHEYPCFFLYYNEAGEIVAEGHPYYNLTDREKLADILREAIATGKEEGILRDRDLHFLKKTAGGRTEYVFADIAGQRHTLRTLLVTCILIFIIAMAAFGCISWRLSRQFVRPVEIAWQQQRQFVADASHELKTPLTVILTNAELLQSGEFDAQANQRFSNSILTMAQQMRGLVEHLLELARMDNHQLQQVPTEVLSLSELTEGCVMSFEPVFFEADRFLDSDVQPGLTTVGSKQHLQQVVDILLDNACKYSAPQTHTILTLSRSRNSCTLQVRSQGETMTEQQCRDIFKRFYRGNDARSMNGSYGLGLSIAGAIVREHRGKIYAQSKDGFNTFTVTLPLREAEK